MTVGAAAVSVALYDVARMAGIQRRAARYQRDYTYDCVIGDAGGDAGPPRTVVVLGDSTVSGDACSAESEALPHQIGVHLQRMVGGSVRLVARGVSGATIRQVAEHQVAALAGVDADAVVISAGVNDAVARRSPDRVAHDVGELLTAAQRSWPDAAIVLIACPDLRHAPGLPRPINLLVSRSTRQVCQAQQRAGGEVPVVVLPRPARATFAVDGFHPAPATLRLIAALACGALLPGLRAQRAHP